MGILDGKTVLITGVRTKHSIAYEVAKLAVEQGAEVILTAPPADMKRAQRTATQISEQLPVLEFDVTADGSAERLEALLRDRGVTALHGVLHAIAYAPASCISRDYTSAPWEDVSVALQVSAYSLLTLANACRPFMSDGGSIVVLTLDSTTTWDGYGWMGAAKGALESCIRYLARDFGAHGIRVNGVSAGIIESMSAQGIEGLRTYRRAWEERAMMNWDSTNAEPVGRTCVALLSDWLPATTAEIIHADAGLHAVGDFTQVSP